MELQFKSVLVKNFHDLNFNDWSNNCSSRNCCNDSGSWVYWRKRVILDIMESTAQNCRPCQVWFWSSNQLQPDARKLRLRMPLWIELSQSPECFSANCFQMQVLEKIPKVLLLENSHLIIHLWSRLSFQEVFLVPFHPLSNRIVHTYSKLLRRYWAPFQNEWFGISVLCLKHPHWSVWCLCHSSFSEFHESKHWYSWILDGPISLSRSTIWVAVKSHFPSGV